MTVPPQQEADGSRAVPQAPDLRRHLSPAGRRPATRRPRPGPAAGSGSGRALRGVSRIQRGQLTPHSSTSLCTGEPVPGAPNRRYARRRQPGRPNTHDNSNPPLDNRSRSAAPPEPRPFWAVGRRYRLLLRVWRPEGPAGRWGDAPAERLRVVDGVRVERLDPDRHDRSAFCCGDPVVDGWLSPDAVADDWRASVAVQVASDGGGVVGCYRLASFQVQSAPSVSSLRVWSSDRCRCRRSCSPGSGWISGGSGAAWARR